MRFLITGGTGHLGRALVSRLLAGGHSVRVLARRPGVEKGVEWVFGDLGTGEGIEAGVRLVDRVVHAATHSPVAQRGALDPVDLLHTPQEVDVSGTRLLLEAAGRAGVEHFTYVSVVGLRHTRLLPYSRTKLAAEALVRRAPMPWTIVRATPFYWLLDRMFAHLIERQKPIVIPGNISLQPVDSDEFARFVGNAAIDGRRGELPDYAGPEVLTLHALLASYLEARRQSGDVRDVWLPGFVRNAISRGQTAVGGFRGDVTWDAWLSAHTPNGWLPTESERLPFHGDFSVGRALN